LRLTIPLGVIVTIIFPRLLDYNDITLLLIRIMIAAVYITSGWPQLRDPVAKGKQNDVNPGLMRFVGMAEVLGGLGVLTGVLAQLAAIGLILIMFGAIKKKMLDWHTGFWGKDNQGWSYDLGYVLMCLVIVTTGGGRYVLPSLF
jgi:putative oxidoreductase